MLAIYADRIQIDNYGRTEVYFVPYPSFTPTPLGKVSNRLSSKAELRASAQSGSTSPFKMIQVVESPAVATTLDNKPSFHSLTKWKKLPIFYKYIYISYILFHFDEFDVNEKKII